jgi:hypothetical protein
MPAMVPALTVPPSFVAVVPHPIRRVSASRGGRAFVVTGPEGRYSMLDGELRAAGGGTLGRAIDVGVLVPGSPALVFTSRDALVCADLHGRVRWTHEHRRWRHAECGAVAVTEDGELLTVAPMRDGAPGVQRRDPSSGLTLDESPVEALAESGFHLSRTPDATRFLIWAGAGQDGQQTFFVELDGGLRVREAAALGFDHGPPAVSEAGDEALVPTEGAILRTRFPSFEQTGRHSPGDADPFFVTEVAWLGEHALLHESEEGRLLLLDVRAMELVHELRIEGHGADVRFIHGVSGRGVVVAHARAGEARTLTLLEPAFRGAS